ncbi:MAG: hypothetical protein BJ554DRAFT_1587, partial [Olpidium bornovanus]
MKSCRAYEACCGFPDGVIPQDAINAGADGGGCKLNIFDKERCPNPDLPQEERECMPGGDPPLRFCQTNVTEGDFDIPGKTCVSGEWCCKYEYPHVQWLGYEPNGTALTTNEGLTVEEANCAKKSGPTKPPAVCRQLREKSTPSPLPRPRPRLFRARALASSAPSLSPSVDAPLSPSVGARLSPSVSAPLSPSVGAPLLVGALLPPSGDAREKKTVRRRPREKKPSVGVRARKRTISSANRDIFPQPWFGPTAMPGKAPFFTPERGRGTSRDTTKTGAGSTSRVSVLSNTSRMTGLERENAEAEVAALRGHSERENAEAEMAALREGWPPSKGKRPLWKTNSKTSKTQLRCWSAQTCTQMTKARAAQKTTALTWGALGTMGTQFADPGGAVTVIDFIEKMETAMEAGHFTPTEALALATNKLTGQASLFWKSHSKDYRRGSHGHWTNVELRKSKQTMVLRPWLTVRMFRVAFTGPAVCVTVTVTAASMVHAAAVTAASAASMVHLPALGGDLG